MGSVVPKTFQGLLWSRSVEKLNLEKDKSYIIQQILAYGDFDQLNWLKKHYQLKEIRKVFLENPQKLYTPAALNFAKNYFLGLEERKIDERKYLKTELRDSR